MHRVGTSAQASFSLCGSLTEPTFADDELDERLTELDAYDFATALPPTVAGAA